MLDAVAELGRSLAGITATLAREDPITHQSVQSKLQEQSLGGLTEKQVLKAILTLTTDYRRHGQLGRVRATLLFAGMRHAGIPIRDFSSIAKLTQDGVVRMGIAKDNESVLRRFRVISKDEFSADDLDDYLDADSKFFRMFGSGSLSFPQLVIWRRVL
jgi:hypothetical protein